MESKLTNWRPNLLLQEVLAGSRIHDSNNNYSSKGVIDHHITTIMFDCRYALLESNTFVWSVHRIFPLKPKESSRCYFYYYYLGKCEAFLFSLVSCGLQLSSLPWMFCLPSVFLTNTDSNWSLQCIECLGGSISDLQQSKVVLATLFQTNRWIWLVFLFGFEFLHDGISYPGSFCQAGSVLEVRQQSDLVWSGLCLFISARMLNHSLTKI